MESLRIVLSAIFLNVISVMRHLSRYALWQDIFKFVIPFTYCAMISFHCVVNNDPGVDKYTQEGLEVNSGFSQKSCLSRHSTSFRSHMISFSLPSLSQE